MSDNQVTEATTEATKKSDDGSSDEDKSKAPDAYADFSVDDGLTLDETLLAEATPLFKEMNLTQEQAQKLVDFQSKQVQARSQAYDALMETWVDECKNDSEFGGDKFDESLATAQAAVNKFGTPGLKELLEQHGVGNHPEMVRFMVKVGKLTAEDVPGASGGNVSPKQDRASLMYPPD